MSAHPYPVHLAYHWLRADGEYFIFDGERTRIIPDARSGASDIYEMTVTAPAVPGKYVLRITLVQEWIGWFDQPPHRVYRDLPIWCDTEE